jgi:hypothetical protein
MRNPLNGVGFSRLSDCWLIQTFNSPDLSALNALVLYPSRKAPLLLFSAKLNIYFEQGIIPQKGSFVE